MKPKGKLFCRLHHQQSLIKPCPGCNAVYYSDPNYKESVAVIAHHTGTGRGGESRTEKKEVVCGKRGGTIEKFRWAGKVCCNTKQGSGIDSQRRWSR